MTQPEDPLEILVTNTECVTDGDSVTIKLYGRDLDEERHTVEVAGFRPYFYVLASEADRGLLGECGIHEYDFDVDYDPFDYAGTDNLCRVYVDRPNQIRDAKELFDRTFEADVNPTNRFRIDTDQKAWIRVPADEVSIEEVEAIEAPTDRDPDPRVCVFDIEVDDRGGFPEHGEKRITSIVAYDTYEQEYHGFIDGARREIDEMFPEGKPEELDKVFIEPTEKRMLISFGCWMAERDPDLICGWNAENFDAPYLVERMKQAGANPSRISPEGEAYVNYYDEAEISGRTVYDLLAAYKNNSWSELRSYSLDYVAGAELGESKISHEEGYFEMWAEKPAKLMNYNGRDTRLTAEINDTAGVVSFRDRLRKMIGVDFEDTRNNYQFIEMLVRRQLRERGEVGPTKTKSRDEDYEGGYVVDPFTGVAKNVIGIDLASLYPMTMKMLNLSPEVKLPNYTGDPVPGEVVVAPNGVAFSQEEDGLFREIVDKALELKAEYKDLKKSAPAGSPLEEMYEEMYQVSKTIVNSIYGVIGWVNFFLYDMETAEAITLSGQRVLKETARFVNEETNAKVIYGDTDSNYIRFPEAWSQEECLEAAEEICAHLTSEIYPALAEEMGVKADDCLWDIEIEMFAERFFQWGKKKKYAYKAPWKEGMDSFADTMDEPDIAIKGSAAKRSDASRITRDTEKKIIKLILNDAGKDELADVVYNAGTAIDPEDPDWEKIGIPSGIRKELDSYETKTARVLAAENANTLCGTEFGKGSKPMRCYLMPTYFDETEEIDVIGYESVDDLAPIEDRLSVDVGRMTNTLLVNPLDPVLDAVGVDVEAAVSGQLQTGLGAFL